MIKVKGKFVTVEGNLPQIAAETLALVLEMDDAFAVEPVLLDYFRSCLSKFVLDPDGYKRQMGGDA